MATIARATATVTKARATATVNDARSTASMVDATGDLDEVATETELTVRIARATHGVVVFETVGGTGNGVLDLSDPEGLWINVLV